MELVHMYYIAGIFAAVVAFIGLFKVVSSFRAKNVQKSSVKGNQNIVVQKATNESESNKTQ